MEQVSEKWEVQVGKEKLLISGKEKDKVLEGAAKGVKFVVFRNLIINPAFVMSIILVETNAPQLTGPKRFIETETGDVLEF